LVLLDWRTPRASRTRRVSIASDSLVLPTSLAFAGGAIDAPIQWRTRAALAPAAGLAQLDQLQGTFGVFAVVFRG